MEAFWNKPYGHFRNISKWTLHWPFSNIWTEILCVNVAENNWKYWPYFRFNWLFLTGCKTFWIFDWISSWLIAKHFDWLPNTLIDCQNTLIYCQNILINCQKFPTMLITSIKNALDSTLAWNMSLLSVNLLLCSYRENPILRGGGGKCFQEFV